MGGKRLGFTDYELTTAKKQTNAMKQANGKRLSLRWRWLVVPWSALIELVETHYPNVSKTDGGPPYPFATMLRMHLLQ